MQANVSREFYEMLQRNLPSYQKHWIKCNSSCQFQDCYFESIHPHVQYCHFPNYGSLSVINNITIEVHPSNDQVITVTSTPKMTMLDFVVYSLSVISIRFGISP